jgi:hypothetical protein
VEVVAVEDPVGFEDEWRRLGRGCRLRVMWREPSEGQEGGGETLRLVRMARLYASDP